MAAIIIDGVIDEWQAMLVTSELEFNRDADVLDIYITSGGGSIIDGINILAKLNAHQASQKNVYIQGLAGSMGGIISQVKDANITMSAEGWFMIHDPSGAEFGGSEDMRRAADLLDNMREQLLDVLMIRANVSREEMSDIMEEETWLRAEQALELGLIDSIGEPVAIAASVVKSLSIYNNLPDELKQKIKNKGADTMARHKNEASEELEEEILEESSDAVEETEAESSEEVTEEFDNVEELEEFTEEEEVFEHVAEDAQNKLNSIVNGFKKVLRMGKSEVKKDEEFKNFSDLKTKYNNLVDKNQELAEHAADQQEEIENLDKELKAEREDRAEEQAAVNALVQAVLEN